MVYLKLLWLVGENCNICTQRSISITGEFMANKTLNKHELPVDTQWTLADYIKERVDEQQEYHSKKADKTNFRYKVFKTVEIAAAALAPISIYFKCADIAMILSIIVAIIAGLLTLGNYQSDWTRHRMTSEQLKAEKAMFLSRCAPYDKAGASDDELLKELAKNIESILAKESEQWNKSQQQKPKHPPKPPKLPVDKQDGQ